MTLSNCIINSQADLADFFKNKLKRAPVCSGDISLLPDLDLNLTSYDIVPKYLEFLYKSMGHKNLCLTDSPDNLIDEDLQEWRLDVCLGPMNFLALDSDRKTMFFFLNRTFSVEGY